MIMRMTISMVSRHWKICLNEIAILFQSYTMSCAFAIRGWVISGGALGWAGSLLEKFLTCYFSTGFCLILGHNA